MNTTSLIFVVPMPCNMFKSITVTFDYSGSRSDAIMALVKGDKRFQDAFIIDWLTGCNVTFDCTLSHMGATKRYNSDYSDFTYNDMLMTLDFNEHDPVVRSPFVRYHYSKSGKSHDYLRMRGRIANKEYENKTLFRDDSKAFEGFEFTRNEFDEIICIGAKS